MNKMNLPPPFEGLEEEHEEIREAYDMEKYKDLFNITIVSQKDNGIFIHYLISIILLLK